MMFPVVLPPGPEADLIRFVAEKVSRQTVGLVMPRDDGQEEEEPVDVEERFHSMATALVSLARGTKPPGRLAMTGELTLTGRVLPVGGIKEKMIAAKRARIRDVILPEANRKDFEEIPEKVRRGLTPHYVENYFQVFRLVFRELGRK